MKKTNSQTFDLVMTASFVTIIILQAFIPFLGNIPIFILTVTLIHITVILGACLLGWKRGLFLGTVWGLTSFIRAFTGGNPVSLLVFSNPIIAFIPRMLVGLVTGYLFTASQDVIKNQRLRLGVMGALGAFINTGLVLSLIYLLLRDSYAQAVGETAASLPTFLMAVIFSNGVPEMIVGAILTSVIGSVLFRLKGQRGDLHVDQ